MDCEPCKRIHHGACPASYTRDGKPICIWCADDLPCNVQRAILKSGDSARQRAVFIIAQLRRPKLQEDQTQMSATATTLQTETAPAPTSRAPRVSHGPSPIKRAARLCATCGKNPLSYNNVSHKCTHCQRQHGRHSKTNGHNGARPHRELEHKAAPNGNGKPNGALPVEDPIRAVGSARIESRVDRLLAAVPIEDKARLLSAWLTGAF